MEIGSKVMISKWDEYRNYDPDISRWKINLDGVVGEVQRVDGELVGIHYSALCFYAGSVPISLLEIVHEPAFDETIRRIASGIDEHMNEALQCVNNALESLGELERLLGSLDEDRASAFTKIIDLIEADIDRYVPVDDGHDNPNSLDGGVY